MDLIGGLQINIKQEPLEDFACEQFGKKSSELLSVSSQADSDMSVTAETVRGEKRKDPDIKITNMTADKRKRYTQNEPNDGESFSDDYGNTKTASLINSQEQSVNDLANSKMGKLGKFQCLLCDDAFDTENELIFHLSLVHKHTPSSNNRRQSSRFSRHTCQVCFARFRTLKDFFNHTSCHASHPSLNSADRELSTRVSNSLSKNALQNYFLSTTSGFGCRDLMQPTFKCDCCSTVFINRDSYAMHVMMRVKNESCKTNGTEQSMDMGGMLQSSSSITNGDLSKSPGSASGSHTDDNRIKSDGSPSPSLHQAYYIDVTSAAEKDEYLQSVLAKNTSNTASSESFNLGSVNETTKKARKCVVCEELFDDQDSLAMHVMSHHSENMTSSQSTRNAREFNKPPSPPISSQVMKYFSPFAHDRLLTLQAEVLYCEVCGQSFVNRDALAMHVLTHIRDHQMPTSTSLMSLTDSMIRGKKPSESIDLTRYQRQNGSAITSNLEINTDEPLNLAAKKNQSSESNSGEKENRETSDLNVSIDLRMSREDGVTDVIEKDTKSSCSYLPSKDLVTHRNRHENCGLKSPIVSSNTIWIRSSSAPGFITHESPTNERAASTGCLPSASKMEGISANLFFSRGDICRPQSFTNVQKKIENANYDKKSEENSTDSITLRHKQMQASTGTGVHSGNSLEGLLGFDGTGITRSQPQLLGCPYMASDGKQPPIMTTLMKNKDLHMCKYCEIIFPNRTLYYLHMGLHNVNTPWQCNMCGKVCVNVHDFNAHIIHI